MQPDWQDYLSYDNASDKWIFVLWQKSAFVSWTDKTFSLSALFGSRSNISHGLAAKVGEYQAIDVNSRF